MSTQSFLTELEDEKKKLALGLCERPADSYEKYMNIVGRYQGLELAKTLLLNSVRSEREKGEDNG